MFGSGASHSIYAQFIKQSISANSGRAIAIGLLCGAGTRMATWFYAAHRALRLKDVLLATVHQPQFTDLELVKNDDRVRLAVLDIRDPMFWKSNYTPLRAIFPVLRALRYIAIPTLLQWTKFII